MIKKLIVCSIGMSQSKWLIRGVATHYRLIVVLIFYLLIGYLMRSFSFIFIKGNGLVLLCFVNFLQVVREELFAFVLGFKEQLFFFLRVQWLAYIFQTLDVVHASKGQSDQVVFHWGHGYLDKVDYVSESGSILWVNYLVICLGEDHYWLEHTQRVE